LLEDPELRRLAREEVRAPCAVLLQE
jgi:hypothetical protein